MANKKILFLKTNDPFIITDVVTLWVVDPLMPTNDAQNQRMTV